MERRFDGCLTKLEVESERRRRRRREGRTRKVEGVADVEVKWAEIKGRAFKKGVNCKGACISLLCVCASVIVPQRRLTFTGDNQNVRILFTSSCNYSVCRPGSLGIQPIKNVTRLKDLVIPLCNYYR
jgi:hypothetical protein